MLRIQSVGPVGVEIWIANRWGLDITFGPVPSRVFVMGAREGAGPSPFCLSGS